MDQKRAMLYPDIDPAAHHAATRDHRISASAAMGLPTEAPPSYDMAIASTSTPNGPHSNSGNSSGPSGVIGDGAAASSLDWHPSAPPTATTPVTQPQAPVPPHRQPRTAPQQTPLQHDSQTRPVIVVQPLPHNQQQPHAPPIQTANTSVPIKLGPNPCAVTCPVCGATKTTRMVFTPNTRTHICAGLLCLAGWCCCACTVPYCMNSCRTGNHYCSQCNTFLGVYNPRRARK
ncbi:lipopolysaccharide-induced tumor necrosis factor-alpha factor homolog [Zeugodacus cucurbitae]|uniref:lipopolysaccharide-induced tumor necrosis factor-alpha factor homolog n=1 Tax=Zeugodacus cucurbitae TaxID=28588 RepID=UPI0005969955|nr:lipopolysaccharide-induced tumor necrosis factor-alpha factor homolog [Zeugodacus cucurbitae]XP_011178856.1 lipopolysaccharide-induced tumor necrosis factor-alpha factor homolog [Zeugodacus cucurbitae]